MREWAGRFVGAVMLVAGWIAGAVMIVAMVAALVWPLLVVVWVMKMIGL